jgi:hypothetical protein
LNVIITIEDKHLKEIDSIARTLRRMGLKIDQVLRISGVISGSVQKRITHMDLKIKGVKSVEFSRKVSAIE